MNIQVDDDVLEQPEQLKREKASRTIRTPFVSEKTEVLIDSWSWIEYWK